MSAVSAPSTEVRSTPWWLVLIQGIASLVVGILLLTYTGITTVVIVQFLGIYFIVQGILWIVAIFTGRHTVHWILLLLGGLLGVWAGIIVIQHPLYSALFIPTVVVVLIAIQAIIVGVISLIQAFSGGGWGIGILGVLGILIGIWLLVNPLAAAIALPWVLGLFMVAGGIIAIIGAFTMPRS